MLSVYPPSPCSGWPTIPQLFVQGELVGGCDIMTQMHQNGDLEKLVSPVKDAKQ
jgi:monothiol glutaredoxin